MIDIPQAVCSRHYLDCITYNAALDLIVIIDNLKPFRYLKIYRCDREAHKKFCKNICNIRFSELLHVYRNNTCTICIAHFCRERGRLTAGWFVGVEKNDKWLPNGLQLINSLLLSFKIALPRKLTKAAIRGHNNPNS